MYAEYKPFNGGKVALQGSHQDAQKSTSTNLFSNRVSDSDMTSPSTLRSENSNWTSLADYPDIPIGHGITQRNSAILSKFPHAST